MVALLIVSAYVVIWVIYGWRLTIHLLDARVRHMMQEFESDRRKGAAVLAAEERGEYLALSFMLAMWWPITLPARAAYRALSGGGGLRTPIEREEAQRQELDALRKLAREHGLPMPDGPR